METQEEFETRYAEASGVTREELFGVHLVSLPCTCEVGGLPPHWAAVVNRPDMINDHLADEARRNPQPEPKMS